MADTVDMRDSERLILVMLCELYEKLGIKGEIDPKFVKEAIYSGNLWGLTWKYGGIFEIEEKHPDTVSEVTDILDMYWFIETTYARLSDEDKERIKKEAEPFGDDVVFKGFDGNNELEHKSVAHFLIDQLDRFSGFEGRYLNSHYPSIETYRRMLSVFLPMRKTLGFRQMNADDIIALLTKKTHPSHLAEAKRA